jgi:hypothetical protein
MRKILILAIILVLIAIVGTVVMVGLAGMDISPPDTADLIPDRAVLPPEQNGYTYFVSATNSLFVPKNASILTGYLKGKPVDESVIQEIVSRNKSMLDVIGKGLDCQRCITPNVTGFDTKLPYITNWLQMGQVMALMVRNERLNGNYTGATLTCISILQFANLIQKDAGCVINYLVGLSIMELGLTQARDLASDEGTPSEELTRLSEGLAAVGPFQQGLIRGMKVEYDNFIKTIDQLKNGKYSLNELAGLDTQNRAPAPKAKIVSSYFFLPNKTNFSHATFIRSIIKNAPLCFGDMKMFPVEDGPQLRNKVRLIIYPNSVGKILLALSVPALQSTLEKKCNMECSLAATRLIVACNAYRRKEGRLPDSLQSIVPTYLASVPVDPFDGKPFRYSQPKGIVYSVGKDLKDSGGSTKLSGSFSGLSPSQKRLKAEDIVFEITPKAEQAPVN